MRFKRFSIFSIGVLLSPFVFAFYLYWQIQSIIPLFIYLLLSILTFILYCIDKRRAIHQQWRIPEFTLHLFELMGGWSGALFAQKIIRHKNKKQSYQVVFWLIVILHTGLWMGALYYFLC